MIERNKASGIALALGMMLGAVPALAQTTPTVPGSPASTVQQLEQQRARASELNQQGMTNTNTGDSGQTRQIDPANAGAPNSAVPGRGETTLSEAEARVRLAAAGYPRVIEMRVDERGMWRGRAIRNDQQVSFLLDNLGNVTVVQ
jgi:hypothetical protein